MLGNLGFSYIGLIYMLMLTIPNIIWARNKPKGYEYKDENKILLLFERIGQVLVTCTVLVFSDFNLHKWSMWSMWLIISVIFMIMYEFWWIRYFKSNKKLKDFYSSFIGIPLVGATLPVLGFLLLGIYGKVIWLILSVIVLGIGHIGIHMQHSKQVKKEGDVDFNEKII